MSERIYEFADHWPEDWDRWFTDLLDDIDQPFTITPTTRTFDTTLRPES